VSDFEDEPPDPLADPRPKTIRFESRKQRMRRVRRQAGVKANETRRLKKIEERPPEEVEPSKGGRPGRINWTEVYTGYLAGVSLRRLAAQQKCSHAVIARKAKENGWDQERRKVQAEARKKLHDRVEDLVIEESERIARTHFRLYRDVIERIETITKSIVDPKSARELAVALDICVKGQRLSAGLPLNNAVYQKGETDHQSIAEDLDAALAQADGPGGEAQAAPDEAGREDPPVAAGS